MFNTSHNSFGFKVVRKRITLRGFKDEINYLFIDV